MTETIYRIRGNTRTGFLRCVYVALAVVGVLSCLPTRGHAQNTVLPGWDLWLTNPLSTLFIPSAGSLPLVGVPYGTFDFTTGTGGDFGRGIGTQFVDGVDTVVKRLNTATAPSSPVALELVGLQMRTALPVNLGAGTGLYFITLQSARGGPASPGQMTINFNGALTGGTFTTDFLQVFYDIRFGSLTGPIVASDVCNLRSNPTGWSHEPLPGTLLINGVNNNLNGQNHLADFHPTQVVEFSDNPPGTVHIADPPFAPEPGTLGLMAFGLLIGIARRRQRP